MNYTPSTVLSLHAVLHTELERAAVRDEIAVLLLQQLLLLPAAEPTTGFHKLTACFGARTLVQFPAGVQQTQLALSFQKA